MTTNVILNVDHRGTAMIDIQPFVR